MKVEGRKVRNDFGGNRKKPNNCSYSRDLTCWFIKTDLSKFVCHVITKGA
jgi:hypothetical protein